jgi:hypothetical protein
MADYDVYLPPAPCVSDPGDFPGPDEGDPLPEDDLVPADEFTARKQDDVGSSNGSSAAPDDEKLDEDVNEWSDPDDEAPDLDTGPSPTNKDH